MTIELSKTQTEALQSGAAHDAGHITLPATLRGGARQKVLASLIVGKLAAYRSGTLMITAAGMAALGKGDAAIDDGAGSPGHAGETADAAIAASTPEVQMTATTNASENEPSLEGDEPATTTSVEAEKQADAPLVTTEPTEAVPTESSQPAKPPRTGTKQAQLIEMLRRPEGATIDEVVKALDWQAHTVRGAMAGALKKKLGLKVESEKEGERGRVYRICG